MVLSRVEYFTGANADNFSINDDAIGGFVNEAAELIKISEEHLQARLDGATADFLSKQQEVDQLSQRINEVRTEHTITNNEKNNGRYYRSMTFRRIRRADWDQELMNSLDAANEEWQIATRERNTSENSVQEQRLEIEAKREG